MAWLFGISALAILEKHREFNNSKGAHLVIEPNDTQWGGVAEFNIENAGLTEFMDIRYLKSDDILPKLYYEKHRIQFAYIDTVKLFDTVLQDFYFIDKILDVNGAVIFDDCGGSWPGVQRVARFVNNLPHYKVLAGHNKVSNTKKKNLKFRILKSMLEKLPQKNLYYPTINFQTDEELGLNYRCIAFQKISEDKRNWDWDASF